MFYNEDKTGQMLQEGINEAGAMCVVDRRRDELFDAGVPMVPFYIFYSMFGFQRVGDLAWAAGDERCRGFLLGGTSGRTTLNGEACSTRTATAISSRRRCRTASPTIRRSPTKSRSSSRTA